MSRSAPTLVAVPDLDLPGVPIIVSLWHARPGQRLAPGQPLVELAAGPVVVDVAAPGGSRLVERRAEEGDLVEPGRPLALLAAAGRAVERPPQDG